VNFGMESGAAAVTLLNSGIGGVTIAGVVGKEVRYMAAHDAIKQRHVDLEQVGLFEQLGKCFGRKKQEFAPQFKKLKMPPDRYM